MRKPCCEKEMTKKGAWSEEEDTKLITYIRNHGEGNWTSLPQAAGLVRCPKSCRLRWLNYLRPDIKRGDFAEDEEDLIHKLHALLGNRWSLIAGRLPGRTDNEVKNYWNSRMRKKLSKKGIDHVKIRNPNSHQKFHHEEMMKPADEKVDDEKKNQLTHDGDDQEAATNNIISMEAESAKIDLNLKLSL